MKIMNTHIHFSIIVRLQKKTDFVKCLSIPLLELDVIKWSIRQIKFLVTS